MHERMNEWANLYSFFLSTLFWNNVNFCRTSSRTLNTASEEFSITQLIQLERFIIVDIVIIEDVEKMDKEDS